MAPLVPVMKLALAARWPRRLVGMGLFLASLSFLARTLAGLDPLGRMALLDAAAHAELLCLAAIYGASLMLLARGWAAIADENKRLPLPVLIVIYGRSVIAKYVPGGVLQYGTRQWLGARAGLRHGMLFRASLAEIALHLLLATAVILVSGGICGLTPPVLGVAACLALFVLAAVGLRASQRALLAAASLQAGFFALFWLLSLLTARIVVGDAALAAMLATIFLAGWLAGFVLPFVPGGIGVREATIVALGAGLADPATLLAYAALTRLVTLGGDLALGLAAYLVPPLGTRLNRQASARQ